ncbi:hypothetical protein CEE69_03175 [Rhodopirellula bahusiensis]|uniref:Uncharacterized protein n=1 Tax=Rhodopirellula bahusiensis TaxID=2014065 RepID=A0A2G1WBK1_9BACT|nr:hypothetical protein CEE69_03175 [Rhodopirellula bahusiensis]
MTDLLLRTFRSNQVMAGWHFGGFRTKRRWSDAGEWWPPNGARWLSVQSLIATGSQHGSNLLICVNIGCEKEFPRDR